jgi:hypothetical protein
VNGQPVKYLIGKTSADDFLVAFTEAQHTFVDQLENANNPQPITTAVTTKSEDTQMVTDNEIPEDDGKTIHKGLSMEEQQKR